MTVPSQNPPEKVFPKITRVPKSVPTKEISTGFLNSIKYPWPIPGWCFEPLPEKLKNHHIQVVKWAQRE